MADHIPMPHGTEELRDDIHAILARYPELTISETVGALEIVKLDIISLIREGP